VSKGLATTFQVLTRTDNQAAVPLLLTALDSANELIQEKALVSLLSRRDPSGRYEILRRMPNISQRWREIILQHTGRMTKVLRDTLLGTDLAEGRIACQAAACFRDYDLIPALLTVMEDETSPNSDMAATTLSELVESLYGELSASTETKKQRDPQTVRRNAVGSLESSVNRYARHKRREAIEALVLLAPRDNIILKQILDNPHHAAFLPTVDILSNNQHGGVVRLLLSFLDDPKAPSAVITVVAKRGDELMVKHLLRKIGHAPSAVVAQNIKRMAMIPWLSDNRLGSSSSASAGEDRIALDQLDGAAQHSAVHLAVTSGIPRQEAFSIVEYFLLSGKPAGRREAARLLANFQGAEANALALKALDDPDPQVQVNLLKQLRHRGIPGILPRLLEKIDSRHALVRKAARENLQEFSFKHFVSIFDTLDERSQKSTGMLVKKVDPGSAALLKEELDSLVRSRRLRALAIVRVMELAEQLEERVVELLHDSDHLVRVAAANALASASSVSSRQFLEDALHDRSELVQEAARNSLFARL
jgi:HEAT repeat protein